MRIYVVIIKDRHCDISVKLFKDRELAIKKAKELANTQHLLENHFDRELTLD